MQPELGDHVSHETTKNLFDLNLPPEQQPWSESLNSPPRQPASSLDGIILVDSRRRKGDKLGGEVHLAQPASFESGLSVYANHVGETPPQRLFSSIGSSSAGSGKRAASDLDQYSDRGKISGNNHQVKPLNVRDWNFLKEGSEGEMEDEDYIGEYFKFLKNCKGEAETGSSFFITKDQAIKFQTTFLSRREDFEFHHIASTINQQSLQTQLYSTLLRISDDKINLGRYPIFTNEILAAMKQKLESKLNSMKNPPPEHQPSIKTLMKFVEDVTKVTHLQIVAYMTLFKEHEEEYLTESQVEQTLTFLKALWLHLCDFGQFKQEKAWAVQVHKLLNFSSANEVTSELPKFKNRMYLLCWNLVSGFWVEHTKRPFISPDGRLRKFEAARVIDKIIFYSNPKRIINAVERNKKKKH
jgi:hypothetical protein